MPSLAQAKEALRIYEAKGDTAKANRIRQAIAEAEAPSPYDIRVAKRAEELRQGYKDSLARIPEPIEEPKETGFFEDITSGS